VNGPPEPDRSIPRTTPPPSLLAGRAKPSRCRTRSPYDDGEFRHGSFLLSRRSVACDPIRVAALYDIHGNLPALDAVPAELEDVAPDVIVVGGDVGEQMVVGTLMSNTDAPTTTSPTRRHGCRQPAFPGSTRWCATACSTPPIPT
jgi:hypothetical protein